MLPGGKAGFVIGAVDGSHIGALLTSEEADKVSFTRFHRNPSPGSRSIMNWSSPLHLSFSQPANACARKKLDMVLRISCQ